MIFKMRRRCVRSTLDALVKFTSASSVAAILNNPNHSIDGTHVVVRTYHPESRTPGSISSATQNQPLVTNNGNQPKTSHYDQVMQENLALKYEIGNLQKSLAEAQIYSKTAYDTFQALREKFGKNNLTCWSVEPRYSTALVISRGRTSLDQQTERRACSEDRVIRGPFETIAIPGEEYEREGQSQRRTDGFRFLSDESLLRNARDQRSLRTGSTRLRFVHGKRDLLSIELCLCLGKCQTENAILQAKLVSREQQADARWKELNDQYTRVKKQYDHVSSCIKDFQSKLYYRKRLKTERKDEPLNRSNEKCSENSHDSNDDIVEIVMQVEPTPVPTA